MADGENFDDPVQLTAFTKLDETKDLITSLLSVPIAQEPTAGEDKSEKEQVDNLDRIVIHTVHLIRRIEANNKV